MHQVGKKKDHHYVGTPCLSHFYTYLQKTPRILVVGFLGARVQVIRGSLGVEEFASAVSQSAVSSS